MIAADSTVAVASALRWHKAHAKAVAALTGSDPALAAHALIETFSVLTRLPSERRLTAGAVVEFLREHFRLPPLPLSAAGHERLLQLAVDRTIVGGAVFDALIAATALEAGATLLTLDRRAERTYRLVGVDYRLIS